VVSQAGGRREVKRGKCWGRIKERLRLSYISLPSLLEHKSHCEERSDEANQKLRIRLLRLRLAMTHEAGRGKGGEVNKIIFPPFDPDTLG